MSVRNTLQKIAKNDVAGAATGCFENPHGIGTLYDNDGGELTLEQAREAFGKGLPVEVPNAGAGSYDSVLKALGYVKTEDIETGSSAGDWLLAAWDGKTWHLVWQQNRYPYHGFRYCQENKHFKNLEDVYSWAEHQ